MTVIRRKLELAVGALLVLALCVAPAAALEIVVPAYFYPGGAGEQYWADMNTAAGVVPITAIMNPNSGPGSNLNSDYTSAVESLRSAGGRVIGYVSSSYANRPLQDVLDDIDKYAAWYDIDGIFVDEQTNNLQVSNLDFYESIYNHVKSIDSGWEVMGNPGTTTQEAYLTRPTADRLMVWENYGSTYPGHTPSSWNANHDSSGFVHLLHQLDPGDVSTMEQYVDLAVARNAGGLFFTDDVLPNPWDRLPAFWDQMVAKVADVNSYVPGPQQTLSNPVAAGTILIDGSRNDWQGVTPFDPDIDDISPGPELDYNDLTVANDGANLFIRFTVDETINGPAPGLGIHHNVYIDADQDRTTGYVGSVGQLALGAEYLIQGNTLYEFQGGSQQSFAWGFVEALPVDASNASDVELALSRSAVGDPDTLDLILYADNTGTLDAYPNVAVDGATGGFLRYLLEDPPAIPGDYDNSGAVDLQDYLLWRSQYGAAGGSADGNQDGVVDASDYALWRAAYTPPVEGVLVAVPEGLSIAYCLLTTMLGLIASRPARSLAGPKK